MTTIAHCIATLVLAYSHQEWSEETIALYNELLADIEPGLLMGAVKHFITTDTAQFRPNIAQLRATMAEIMAMDAGLPTPAVAWGIAFRAMDVPYGKTPDFQHEAIKQAIDAMGGWRVVCMSTNTVADRAHFRQAYEQIVARGKKEIVTLPQIAALSKKLEIGTGNE